MVEDIGEDKRNPDGQVYNLPNNERWMFFTPIGKGEEISPFPVLQIPRACELAGGFMFIQG